MRTKQSISTSCALAAAIAIPAIAVSQAAAQNYRIIELPLINGQVPQPQGINIFGQVVGYYGSPGDLKAFIFTPTDCGALSPGIHDLHAFTGLGSGSQSQAFDIGNQGLVVGNAQQFTAREGFTWSVNGGSVTTASYAPGSGTAEIEFLGVNDESPATVVGRSRSSINCLSGDENWGALRLLAGSGILDGYIGDRANDVRNGSGSNDRAVGISNIQCEPCPTMPGQTCFDGRSWTTPSSAGDNLNNSIFFDGYAEGMAINDSNMIVGFAGEASGNPSMPTRFRPAFWQNSAATMVELPTGEPNHDIKAFGISQVLAGGEVRAAGQDLNLDRAIVWTRTGSSWSWAYADSSISTGSGWSRFRTAQAMNDYGWFTGLGVRNGSARAYIAIPKSFCFGADITGPNGSLALPDGVVDFNDLLLVLSSWGTTGAPETLAADVDHDGMVGFGDLLTVLSAWGPCTSEAGSLCGSSLGLSDELSDMGLDMDDWSDYLNVLGNGTSAEIDNWTCWFERYYTQCVKCLPCPGIDPFQGTGSGP